MLYHNEEMVFFFVLFHDPSYDHALHDAKANFRPVLFFRFLSKVFEILRKIHVFANILKKKRTGRKLATAFTSVRLYSTTYQIANQKDNRKLSHRLAQHRGSGAHFLTKKWNPEYPY